MIISTAFATRMSDLLHRLIERIYALLFAANYRAVLRMLEPIKRNYYRISHEDEKKKKNEEEIVANN